MKSIAITDRQSLIAATALANQNAPGSTGSWIAKPEKRAEIVSEPAWQEILRLRAALAYIHTAPSKTKMKDVREMAGMVLQVKHE